MCYHPTERNGEWHEIEETAHGWPVYQKDGLFLYRAKTPGQTFTMQLATITTNNTATLPGFAGSAIPTFATVRAGGVLRELDRKGTADSLTVKRSV